MVIGVVNSNQVESNKKREVNVFKSSAAHVLFVFLYEISTGKVPSVVRTRMLFDVVNANHVDSNEWNQMECGTKLLYFSTRSSFKRVPELPEGSGA